MISEQDKMLFCLGEKVNLVFKKVLPHGPIISYQIKMISEEIQYLNDVIIIDLYVNGALFLSNIGFSNGIYFDGYHSKHNEVWRYVLAKETRDEIQEYIDFTYSDEGQETFKRMKNLELYK